MHRTDSSREVQALVAGLGDGVTWTAEGPQRVDGALAQWEEWLKSHRFLRVNRPMLVNLEPAREVLESNEVLVHWGHFPVSRCRMEGLRMSLGIGILS